MTYVLLLALFSVIQSVVIIIMKNRIDFLNRSKCGYKTQVTPLESISILAMAEKLGMLIQKETTGVLRSCPYIIMRNKLDVFADDDGVLNHTITLSIVKTDSKRTFDKSSTFEVSAQSVIKILKEKLNDRENK